jgi:hypothetical protein
MSKKPWVGHMMMATDGTYIVAAERRLTGRMGKPSTGESKYVVGADGKNAVFPNREAAQDAIDAAMRNDGPWGPVHAWISY